MSRIFDDSPLSRNKRNCLCGNTPPISGLTLSFAPLCSWVPFSPSCPWFQASPPISARKGSGGRELCGHTGSPGGVPFSLSHAHMWKSAPDQGVLTVKGFKSGASWVGLHIRCTSLDPQGHLWGYRGSVTLWQGKPPELFRVSAYGDLLEALHCGVQSPALGRCYRLKRQWLRRLSGNALRLHPHSPVSGISGRVLLFPLAQFSVDKTEGLHTQLGGTNVKYSFVCTEMHPCLTGGGAWLAIWGCSIPSLDLRSSPMAGWPAVPKWK